MIKQAIDIVNQLLDLSITLEGFTFKIGTAILFFCIGGLLAFLIGRMLS